MRSRPVTSSLHGRRRRGAAYVAVLSLSILLTILCVGSIMAVRSQVRSVMLENDTADARAYAMAAIELGRWMIASDSNWRTDYKSSAGNNWFVNRAVGRGTCALNVVNPNGALDNASTDPVILTGTGYAGNATQFVSVTLNAQVTPYTCLTSAMCAGGGIAFGSTTVNPTGALIASNAGITASIVSPYATINPNVQAVTTITGQTYNGTSVSGAAALTLPDPNHVFDYYKANGTAISYSSLPLKAGAPALTNVLLSPASNPYGSTNASGIYVIDCAGGALNVLSTRIVGTLVVLNCSGGLTLQSTNNCVPAVSNYPCVLVQGNLTLKMNNSTNLSDNSTSLINYNPPGTPYPWPNGTSDTTYTTTYPNRIAGLVYATGNLSTNSNQYVDMAMVAGSTTHLSSLTLSYNSSFYANPPPGFCTIQMVVAPQSFRRVVH